MTNAEAIEYIKKNCYGEWCEDDWREAMKMAIEALKCSETPKSSERTGKPSQDVSDSDLILRKAAIEAICAICGNDCDKSGFIYDAPQTEQVILCPEHYALCALPSAEPETCEGCKHLGKWENEVEYGYPSPCTRCKRRVGDHYER